MSKILNETKRIVTNMQYEITVCLDMLRLAKAELELYGRKDSPVLETLSEAIVILARENEQAV